MSVAIFVAAGRLLPTHATGTAIRSAASARRDSDDIANRGDCPGAQVTQGSVAECIDRLGYTNPAALAACIEAMIINGTP